MAEAGGADAWQVCTITAVPAMAMVLGSAAISVGVPSEQFQARLQHLSAGVLVGAVVTEIFPILKQHLLPTPDRQNTAWVDLVAAVLGFTAALVLMYTVKNLDLDGEGGEASKRSSPRHGAEPGSEGVETPDNGKDFLRGVSAENAIWTSGAGDEDSGKLRIWLARLQAHTRMLSRIVSNNEVDRDAVDSEIHGIDYLIDSARRLCRGAEPIDKTNAARLRYHVAELIQALEKLRDTNTNSIADVDAQLRAIAATVGHVHQHAERATFRRWAPRDVQSSAPGSQGLLRAIPLGLVVAVVVDSIIDGMLIGLAGSVASSSGWLMALATAIEMGFLGYSFACSIVSVQRSVAVVILAVPPIAMLASSVCASVGASYVEQTPAFCGLIAFALAALLFLVVQELLIEAHEKEDGEAWHISIFLYVGLFMSIGLDIVL